ncbi:hypothetical protein B0J13DRAFT_520429 [Dactylonectria estremocensis]|uniref:Uncharacterized protein n=1 Tax=Dactylonectria estremocensis TaxID=1079267 RepID=A0A9P9FBK9_9HYPO|nr:hypothetical protein B0J13DRAFT_520429 [Dactylonectria estremocensis]
MRQEIVSCFFPVEGPFPCRRDESGDHALRFVVFDRASRGVGTNPPRQHQHSLLRRASNIDRQQRHLSRNKEEKKGPEERKKPNELSPRTGRVAVLDAAGCEAVDWTADASEVSAGYRRRFHLSSRRGQSWSPSRPRAVTASRPCLRLRRAASQRHGSVVRVWVPAASKSAPIDIEPPPGQTDRDTDTKQGLLRCCNRRAGLVGRDISSLFGFGFDAATSGSQSIRQSSSPLGGRGGGNGDGSCPPCAGSALAVRCACVCLSGPNLQQIEASRGQKGVKGARMSRNHIRIQSRPPVRSHSRPSISTNPSPSSLSSRLPFISLLASLEFLSRRQY